MHNDRIGVLPGATPTCLTAGRQLCRRQWPRPMITQAAAVHEPGRTEESIAAMQTGGRRMKVLVAGAGGAIGTAVCSHLAADHDVVALVGSEYRARSATPHPSIAWHACEPFSRPDVEAAIAGCDYVVYLVHTRVPTALLDQAACEDMDLLIADNVARAASRHGVRQIIHLGWLAARRGNHRAGARAVGEVTAALGFYGTPVTTLSPGLVVAPGSSVLELLGAATRTPLVLVPRWAQTRKQPIAVDDLVRGIRFCLGNQATFGGRFDLGGPTVIDFRELLRSAAAIQGKEPAFLTLPLFPRRLYVAYLRLLDRRAHPELVRLAIENLDQDAVAEDNMVQRFVADGAASPAEIIVSALASAGGRLPANPRDASSRDYVAGLRARRSVRSIQRLALPPAWNAAAVADQYFRWLPRFNLHLVTCRVDDDRSVRVSSRIPRILLLELGFVPEESSARRRLYLITGGLLARGQAGGRPRMEFRDVLGGRHTIVAIHDFAPQLPWLVYRATQAAIHLVVMRAFQRHMARLAIRGRRTRPARSPD